jgi:hypothetical protein
MTDGGKEDRIEAKFVCGGCGDADMATVRWVEGAAEESYAHEIYPSGLKAIAKLR